MCPKGPPSYHSKYVYHNFSLERHGCNGDCGCVAVGCTHHWRWKDGKAPPATIAPWDYPCIDYQMYYFGAYQGWVSGMTKQQRFLADCHNIAGWVGQFDGTTIFCNWDAQAVADVFEKVKAVFAGHTVPTTKALYFLVPDLFVILDRGQVWKPWRQECKSILPRRIDAVNGRVYVELLNYVRAKISSAIKGGTTFTLGGGPSVSISSVDGFRLVTPLELATPQKIGYTLGKVIDNVINGKIPGGSSGSPSGSIPKNLPPSGDGE